MRKSCWVFIVLLSTCVSALNVNILKGEVIDIGINEMLTDFGMVRGSIVFRLGNYSWKPEEIWLVPLGTTPEDFKATGRYLEIPEDVAASKCKTSIYFNSSYGYAFKITSSQILENGSFCGLAYEGVYEIFAGF